MALTRNRDDGEFFALDGFDDDKDATSHDAGDLAFSYEDGMELSRLMPMQEALLLARNNSDINSDVHRTSGTDTISATPEPASTDSVLPATFAAEEVAFEAPLRALEMALAHIQCSDLANLETP